MSPDELGVQSFLRLGYFVGRGLDTPASLARATFCLNRPIRNHGDALIVLASLELVLKAREQAGVEVWVRTVW